MNYRELFASVHRRLGMYGLDGSFSHFCIFLEGCNAGTSWSLLAGFREWLVVQLGEVNAGNNLSWSALIMKLEQVGPLSLFPDQTDHNTGAVETLFRLLDSFLELREQYDSLTKIFREYTVWLERYNVRIEGDDTPLYEREENS